MTTMYIQDPQAKLDYTFDWGLPTGVTITTATVTSPNEAATISGVTHDTTSVTYRLACTVKRRVDIVCHVVLSTGEEDERTMSVTIADR